jgi:hypothetical protein
MNRQRELLAMRKELLVARSTLLRLKAARDVQALREGLSLRGIATSFGESREARTAVFGALLLALGGRRLRRWLRVAAIAVGVAKAVSAFRALAPRPAAERDASRLSEGVSSRGA